MSMQNCSCHTQSMTVGKTMNTEQMIAVNKRMKIKRGWNGGGCNSAGAKENGDRKERG